jgi:hypothetical protein
MIDEFLPLGWYLQRQPLQYGIRGSLPATVPLSLQGAYPSDRSLSPTSHPSMPSSASGGILGAFSDPDGALTSSWAREPRAGGGLLASLAQSVDEPSTDGRNGPAAWELPMPGASTKPLDFPLAWPPRPGSALEFAGPPIEHRDSARYWGAAQMSPPPDPLVHGLYLPPVPATPHWDFLSTSPTNSAARVFQEFPSPESWGTTALGASNSAYSSLPPAGPIDPDRIRLAGMTAPFPGMRPLPPLPLPGTPEWTDHFIRGWQGLINAFRSARRGGSRRKHDDDFCYDRYLAEMRECNERYDDYAHQSFLKACKDRATTRWDSCNRNGGRPRADEVEKWSLKDEEVFRNFNR